MNFALSRGRALSERQLIVIASCYAGEERVAMSDDDVTACRRKCLFKFDGLLNVREYTRHGNGLYRVCMWRWIFRPYLQLYIQMSDAEQACDEKTVETFTLRLNKHVCPLLGRPSWSVEMTSIDDTGKSCFSWISSCCCCYCLTALLLRGDEPATSDWLKWSVRDRLEWEWYWSNRTWATSTFR